MREKTGDRSSKSFSTMLKVLLLGLVLVLLCTVSLNYLVNASGVSNVYTQNTTAPENVYINGDSVYDATNNPYPGNDANTGLSPASPVLTFERAYAVLSGSIQTASADNGIIWVINTVTIPAGSAIELSEGYYTGGSTTPLYDCNAQVTIARHTDSEAGYFNHTGELIVNNTTLTLGNPADSHAFIIDGCSPSAAAGSLVQNSSAKTLNIYGATLKNNYSKNGAAIYNNKGIVNFNSGLITDNSATRYGGGIYSASGSVNISGDAVISRNSVPSGTGLGSAIYVTTSTLNISGGVIGSTTTLTDGNIGAHAIYTSNSNLTVSGGSISYNGFGSVKFNAGIQSYIFTLSGGTISNNGNNIDIYYGTFNMTDGIISNNTSTTSGGGIYNYGTVNISGGTISNNSTATSGGGIYNSGTVNISGGTISYNTATQYGGGIYNASTLTLNGCSIEGNTAILSPASGYDHSDGIFSSSTFNLNASATTISDDIYLSSPVYPITLTGAPDTENIFNIFVSETFVGETIVKGSQTVDASLYTSNFLWRTPNVNDTVPEWSYDYGTVYYNSMINCIGKSPNIVLTSNDVYLDTVAGSDLNSGTLSSDAVATFGRAKELLATRLAGSNIIVSNTITVTGTTNVDLSNPNDSTSVIWSDENGETWTPIIKRYLRYTPTLINVVQGGSLTLRNVTIDGVKDKVTEANSLITTAGTFTMEEGSVLQNCAAQYGGGVTVTGGDFYMNSGLITLNTATYCGAGVYMTGGNMYISGNATISGNLLSVRHFLTKGCGIYAQDASITMTGGEIKENSMFKTWQGTTNVQGIGAYISNGATFIMTAGSINNNVNAGEYTQYFKGSGVFVAEGGTFEMNGSNAIITENGIPIRNEGIGVYNAGTFNMSAGTISNNKAKGNNGSTSGADNCGKGGGIFNAATGNLTITNGTISGNVQCQGGGIYNAGTAVISNTVISSNGATMPGYGNKHAGGGIFNKGNLTITDGTKITGNLVYARYGAGIYSETGTVSISDTEISGGRGATAGSGIYLSSGILNAVNTEIKNNTGTDGTGVYIVSGTATIDGGSITGNKATKNGGGIYSVGGTTTVSGTVIGGNTSESANTSVLGGGIYIDGGEVELATLAVENDGVTTYIDSTVKGNTSTTSGGGVYIKAGSLTLSDGSKIETNTSVNGGGVCAFAGTLNLAETSSISGNTATVSGGGLQLISAVANLTGGTIGSSNTAVTGGGIMASGGTLNVSSGFNIAENEATNGAGLYLSGGTISINGANIADNVASANGGGIYMNSAVDLTITDSEISGNEALNGGGIYNGTVITLDGTDISGNAATSGGGGIYNAGTLNFTETSALSLNTAVSGNGVFQSGTFNISGAPSIPDNQNIYLNADSNSYRVINITGALTLSNPINIDVNESISYVAGRDIAIFSEGVTTPADISDYIVLIPAKQTVWSVLADPANASAYELGIVISTQPINLFSRVGTDIGVQLSTATTGNNMVYKLFKDGVGTPISTQSGLASTSISFPFDDVAPENCGKYYISIYNSGDENPYVTSEFAVISVYDISTSSVISGNKIYSADVGSSLATRTSNEFTAEYISSYTYASPAIDSDWTQADIDADLATMQTISRQISGLPVGSDMILLYNDSEWFYMNNIQSATASLEDFVVMSSSDMSFDEITSFTSLVTPEDASYTLLSGTESYRLLAGNLGASDINSTELSLITYNNSTAVETGTVNYEYVIPHPVFSSLSSSVNSSLATIISNISGNAPTGKQLSVVLTIKDALNRTVDIAGHDYMIIALGSIDNASFSKLLSGLSNGSYSVTAKLYICNNAEYPFENAAVDTETTSFTIDAVIPDFDGGLKVSVEPQSNRHITTAGADIPFTLKFDNAGNTAITLDVEILKKNGLFNYTNYSGNEFSLPTLPTTFDENNEALWTATVLSGVPSGTYRFKFKVKIDGLTVLEVPYNIIVE